MPPSHLHSPKQHSFFAQHRVAMQPMAPHSPHSQGLNSNHNGSRTPQLNHGSTLGPVGPMMIP
ncbi:hypothetical protein Lal_00024563 [Lupinus albus]|nr:hypothetical protein Lal_00024563 [Lupinus albus]